jgi:hypothetical protein
MARENQGLQIGLIVAVMFAIIFGVMAFMFYRSYTDARQEVAGRQEELRKMQGEREKAEDDNRNLKTMIGVGTAVPVPTIREEFDKEMAARLADLPAANRTYKRALEMVNDALQAKNAALAKEQATSQELRTTLEQRENAAKLKFAEALAQQKKAADDLQETSTDFVTRREALTKEQERLRQTVEQTRKKADGEIAKIQADRDGIKAENVKLSAGLGQARGKIEAMTKPTFAKASGRIEWVNQAQRTVWINLGQADHLNRLTTFSVYDGRTGDLTRAVKKAGIEVIQILGSHVAEARITEDKISSPILPGDVIHTPLWEPGRQRHFALAGSIDIDRDGKSDLDLVLTLIRTNGGVVDCWQGEDGKRYLAPGKKLESAIDANTDYLILGTAPEPSAQKPWSEVYNAIGSEAKKWAVKEVRLDDFLSQIGYRPEVRVVQYGLGAPAGQPRSAAPPAGAPKSSGTTSGFQERKPPAPNGKR